ncbi:MAG: hypothetical protein ACFE8U_00155 [Candidatus Hermodarchaeota archaeon]
MIINNLTEKNNLNPRKLRDRFLILCCKTFFVTHGSGGLFWTKIGKDPRRSFIMLYHGTTVKDDGSIANYKEWKYNLKIDRLKHPSKDKKPVFKSPKLINEDFYRLYWIVPSKIEKYFISASLKFPIE